MINVRVSDASVMVRHTLSCHALLAKNLFCISGLVLTPCFPSSSHLGIRVKVTNCVVIA
jgi:hypothetical protein